MAKTRKSGISRSRGKEQKWRDKDRKAFPGLSLTEIIRSRTPDQVIAPFVEDVTPNRLDLNRSQRKIIRNRKKSNQEAADLRRSSSVKVHVDTEALISSEALDGLFHRGLEIEYEHEKYDEHEEVQADTDEVEIDDCNPFSSMKDWRSFSPEIMNVACLPGGIWDTIMDKVDSFYSKRTPASQRRVVLPRHHKDLTVAGYNKLLEKMSVIRAFLDLLAAAHNIDCRLKVKDASDALAYGRRYSGQTVRDWVRDFLQCGGICRGITFKRRRLTSIIHDAAVKVELTKWLLLATASHPSAKAKDFSYHLKVKYKLDLKLGMTLRWIKALGSKKHMIGTILRI